MHCQLTETALGNGRSKYHCKLCGRTTEHKTGGVKRICRKPAEARAMRREILLGDVTEKLIEATGAAYGYKLVRGWLEGLPPSDVDCGGCKDRKDRLNRLHERFLNWVRADASNL